MPKSHSSTIHLASVTLLTQNCALKSFADHEKNLWRAVITQALMDAASKSKKAAARRARNEAREWLLNNSRDFQTVCDHAGLDSNYVREQAHNALLRDCEWRLPSGQGWRSKARTTIIPTNYTKH